MKCNQITTTANTFILPSTVIIYSYTPYLSFNFQAHISNLFLRHFYMNMTFQSLHISFKRWKKEQTKNLLNAYIFFSYIP